MMEFFRSRLGEELSDERALETFRSVALEYRTLESSLPGEIDFARGLRNNPRLYLACLSTSASQAHIDRKLEFYASLEPETNEDKATLKAMIEGLCDFFLIVRVLNFHPTTLLRDLKANTIGKFVGIKGNVVRVGLVRPQHLQMAFKCAICRDEVVAWVLDRECLTWAGSVLDYEAYQASFALRAEAFPFLALILYKQGKMQLVHRVQGCTDYKQVIEELDAAINEHGQDMAIARADRKEMDLARRIREEQDQAYQESLRIDREKQRQRERELEEEQRKRDLERQRELDKERRVHRKEETRKRLLETLPTEPTLEQANAQAKKLCKVAFRLPNGTRVDRKFWEEDVVEALYHFVGTHDLHIEGEEFVLCTNFPRRKIGRSNEVTLKEVGLSPAGMVVVEEVIDGASAE